MNQKVKSVHNIISLPLQKKVLYKKKKLLKYMYARETMN